MPGRHRTHRTGTSNHSKTSITLRFTGPSNFPDSAASDNSPINLTLPSLSLNSAVFNLTQLVLQAGGFSAFIAYALKKIYPQTFTSNYRYLNDRNVTNQPRILTFDIEATGSAVDTIPQDIDNCQLKEKITREINNGVASGQTLTALRRVVIHHVEKGNWSPVEGSSWGVVPVEEAAPRRQSFNIAQPSINTLTGDDNRSYVTHNYIHPSSRPTNSPSSSCIDTFHNAMKAHLVSKTGRLKMPISETIAINPVGIKVSSTLRSVNSVLSNTRMQIITETESNLIPPIELEEIFDHAAAKAEQLCATVSDEAKPMFRKTHGRSILLTGQAGGGKSTATYLLTKKTREIPALAEVDHIGYIQMRDIEFSEKINLIDFVITYATNASKGSYTEPEKLTIEKYIVDNIDKYLFVFDGIDEANLKDLETKTKSCDSQRKCEPSNLIKLIMKGSHLNGSYKLWTSRSQHAFAIDQDHRPLCIMQLLGLNEEAQIELGQQVCTDSWPAVNSILQKNPGLKAMCHVPVWCIIICHVLKSQILQHGRTEISTVTEVLLIALKWFVKSSCVKTGSTSNQNLLTVGKLAWDGLKAHRLIFEDQHFNAAEVSKDLQQCLLHTTLKEGTQIGLEIRIMISEQRSYFVHLIWQEIFGSLHLANMSTQEFKSNISVIEDPFFEVVSCLLFGLFNSKNQELLHDLFPNVKLDDDGDKKDALLEKAGELMWNDGAGQKNLLKICSWAHEMKHDPFTKKISELFPDKIDFSTNNPDNGLTLFPSDVISLNYVLRMNRHSFEKMDMQNVRFIGNSLELFGETLSLTDKVTFLDLSYTAVGEGIQYLAPSVLKISCLDLVGCNITHDGVTQLTIYLKRSPTTQMERLDLSHNNIGDVGIKKLKVVVKNLSELAVEQCGFGNSGWQSLADKIKDLYIPMKTLRLNGNNLGSSGIMILKQCWKKIETVHVRNCGFSRAQMQALSQQVRNMPGSSSHSYGVCEIIGLE